MWILHGVSSLPAGVKWVHWQCRVLHAGCRHQPTQQYSRRKVHVVVIIITQLRTTTEAHTFTPTSTRYQGAKWRWGVRMGVVFGEANVDRNLKALCLSGLPRTLVLCWMDFGVILPFIWSVVSQDDIWIMIIMFVSKTMKQIVSEYVLIDFCTSSALNVISGNTSTSMIYNTDTSLKQTRNTHLHGFGWHLSRILLVSTSVFITMYCTIMHSFFNNLHHMFN